MKASTMSDFKVGLFVFLALAIFLFTLFWTKGISVGLTLKEYSAYFTKVSGLNEGDGVSVNGVKKGEIDKIELVGDSVKIKFNLDKNVSIKKDYQIYVAATELTGGKVLYIEPGKDQITVGDNEPLRGKTGSDFTSLMNSVEDIAGEVKGLISEFKKSNDNLNSVLTNVNDIVGDNGLKANISVTVKNLQTASNNLNQLINDSRSGIGGLTNKADVTMNNLDLAIGENSTGLKNTISEIQNLTIAVDTLVGNLNNVVTDLKSQNSSVGKLIYDDAFYNNMNKTLSEIEKLTKSIRKGGVKINLF
ncbi:MAG: MlaD family protein [Ignavibacteria bacterium]|jgi:phospholipid/cholesterol/gamma-HCH transport system substrate-binding protein